ncbi:MAG: hypothetical protein ACI9CE_001854 [Flavobacterium sp.]|jgi:hypothetical protein
MLWWIHGNKILDPGILCPWIHNGDTTCLGGKDLVVCIHRFNIGMFEEIAEYITDDMLSVPLSDSALTSVAFRAYEQRKSTLTPLLKFCPGFLFLAPCREIIGELLDRIISVNNFHPLPAFEREYLTAIHCSTLHATLTVWVERGFIDPPEQLSELMVKLFGSGIDTFLKRVE